MSLRSSNRSGRTGEGKTQHISTGESDVPITTTVQGVATHPEDHLVIGTAISGQAEYLVTGDVKLQGLAAFGSVTILSPRRFLDELIQEGYRPDDPSR